MPSLRVAWPQLSCGEKEIGFARLSERSSGSPEAQFRHCFFPPTLDAVVESPALSGVSRTIEHFLLTQKKTIPCDTKPTRDFLFITSIIVGGVADLQTESREQNATSPENEVVVLSYEVWPPELNASPFPSTEVSPPKSLIGTERRGPRPARPSRKTQVSFPAKLSLDRVQLTIHFESFESSDGHNAVP